MAPPPVEGYAREYTPTQHQTASARSKFIDTPEVIKKNSSTRDLLDSHKIATENAIAEKQSRYDDIETRFDSKLVTPDALLTTVLAESSSFQEAFWKLNGTGYKELDATYKLTGDSRSQQLLIQQARTLLVRAHPEVVPGLVRNLRLLPNRFVSYFKEKLPTLTEEAGRQRFTQSVVMETVKSMKMLPQEQFVKNIPDEFFKDSHVYNNPRFYTQRPLTTQESLLVFNEQLDTITAKYAESLDSVTSTDMFLQWSRNLIVDVALLAPRVAGGVAGAAIGIPLGTLHGTAKTMYAGAKKGYELGGIAGGTAGVIIGAPMGAVYGAEKGAVSGAVYGSTIV